MASGTFGKWGKVFEALGGFKTSHEGAAQAALMKEAQYLRTKIVEGLREQAPGGKQFKPLSPETLAIRKFLGFRGTKALLKHGDLRNAIAIKKDSNGTIFIGIPRSARSRSGHNLYDIAVVHEHGSKPIVIKMTPKMRALLHLAFAKAGINRRDRARAWRKGAYTSTGIIVVQIPARPFIGPVIEQFGKPADIERRLAESYARYMRSVSGGEAWNTPRGNI